MTGVQTCALPIYCRDEGLRKYWDEQSYPFHKEGDGPLYRNQPAPDYNHNMDQFAVEMVHRWYDYWRERPGTGTRVSSGVRSHILYMDRALSVVRRMEHL